MGGTFDPIHIGHLATAEQAREAYGLDAVVFVPAGKPVFKKDRAVTPAAGPPGHVPSRRGQQPGLSA